MAQSDLARLANDHWRLAYRALIEALGGTWQRIGSVDAFATPHIPVSFANGCLVLEPTEADDVRTAIDLVRKHPVEYRVRVDVERGASVIDVPTEFGLARDEWSMPAMVLTPVRDAPQSAAGVVAELVTAASYDEFIGVLEQGGMSRVAAETAFGTELLGFDGVALFLARLDGRPSATSVLVRTGDVAGIYTVHTVDAARRRGVGTAVTWAAVEHARTRWASDAIVLQSSPMGYHIYEQMGFATVTEYAMFAPRDDAQVTQ